VIDESHLLSAHYLVYPRTSKAAVLPSTLVSLLEILAPDRLLPHPVRGPAMLDDFGRGGSFGFTH
jgi:hypothetical protein